MKKQMLLALPLVLSPVFGEDAAGSAQKDKYCGIEVDAGISCQYTNSDWVAGRLFDTRNGVYSLYGTRFGHARGTKLGGIVGAGYRRFIGGNVLAGLGLNVDLTGNKSSTVDLRALDLNNAAPVDVDAGYFKLKTRGIVPSVYASLGYYLCSIDTLVGLKGGLTYLYSELSSVDAGGKTLKSKGVTPVVGLFVEKNVYGKFNLRAEFDYRLSVSKEFKDYAVRTRTIPAVNAFNDNGLRADLKSKHNGYSVRLVAAYNF